MGSDPLFEDEEDEVVEAETDEAPSHWRPRFGIGGIMLVTFVFCAMAAMGSYLLNPSSDGSFQRRFLFIFVTLAAPMLLLTVLSYGRELLFNWNRKQSRKSPDKPSRY